MRGGGKVAELLGRLVDERARREREGEGEDRIAPPLAVYLGRPPAREGPVSRRNGPENRPEVRR
jgi:hypothetical protein